MQVEVNGNIDRAIRDLKKMIQRDGIHNSIKRRLSFVKPSLKAKEKIRVAEVRRKKKRIWEGRDSINEKSPSWRFIRIDGEYLKMPSKRSDFYQTGIV